MNQASLSPESNPSKETFSIEQGFNVCLLFYIYLWPLIEPKTLEMDRERALLYTIFFCDICMGFESSARWNEAIFRVKKIHKKDQRELKLTEEELFLCTLEFFKFNNELLDSKLDIAAKLLESLRANPQNHPQEMSIWKKAVADSFKTYVLKKFDWSRELP